MVKVDRALLIKLFITFIIIWLFIWLEACLRTHVLSGN